jgi:hypothetical protein
MNGLYEHVYVQFSKDTYTQKKKKSSIFVFTAVSVMRRFEGATWNERPFRPAIRASAGCTCEAICSEMDAVRTPFPNLRFIVKDI